MESKKQAVNTHSRNRAKDTENKWQVARRGGRVAGKEINRCEVKRYTFQMPSCESWVKRRKKLLFVTTAHFH